MKFEDIMDGKVLKPTDEQVQAALEEVLRVVVILMNSTIFL